MKRTYIYKLGLLILSLFCVTNAFADDVKFSASAPSVVTNESQFRLTYTVNADGKNLHIPDIVDFDVLYGPSTSRSQSVSFVNGTSTSSLSISYTYTLMAKKEGTFTIPAATIEVKGTTYSSNAVTIKVIAADKSTQQSGSSSTSGQVSSEGTQTLTDNDLFILPLVTKTSVYEQECFLLTYKLYTKVDIRGFKDAKFPEFQGFFAQEIDLPQEKQFSVENYKGTTYRTVILKQTLLFPQKRGSLYVEPGNFDIVVRLKKQATRRRSFFDDYFDTYQDVNKSIKTKRIEIKVKSLPSGAPSSYANAVGNFKMNTIINSESVKTNEPITIKVTLSGNGNFKVVKNPEIKFPIDFETYDPKITNNYEPTTQGVTGSKTIEFLAIPRFAGDFVIPSVEWSYFNTETGRYQTLKTPEYNIKVEKGSNDSNASQSTIADFTNKETVKVLGKDIRFIQTDNYNVKPKEDLFLGSSAYWTWLSLIVLVSAGLFIFLLKKQDLESDAAYTKNKKAMKIARKRLKSAETSLKANDKKTFYENMLNAVWFYLSDKLNISLANLNKENLSNEMTNYGASEELTNNFINLLNDCEFARYAPSNEENSMEKMYNRALDLVENFENVKKRK